jgi:4-hydroxy-2-oxoheptanedioate aldolase
VLASTFVTVDLQHGGVGLDRLLEAIAGIELGAAAALVRVPPHDATAIQRVLDLGGAGVIVPDVDSAADAAAAVRSCRYPAAGGRSFGQLRGGYGDMSSASREPLCIAMIESGAGLSNVAAIAGVQGLDGVYVGPIDLSLDLGIAVDFGFSDPRLLAAFDKIIGACTAAGIPVGRPVTGPDDIQTALRQAFDS